MNTMQLQVGMKVYDRPNNYTFTIVSDEFINSLENKDDFTCTAAWAEQEIHWGRIELLTN